MSLIFRSRALPPSARRRLQEESRARDLEIEREDKRDDKVARQEARELRRRQRQEEAQANGEAAELSSSSEEDEEEEEDIEATPKPDPAGKSVAFAKNLAENPAEFVLPKYSGGPLDPAEPLTPTAPQNIASILSGSTDTETTKAQDASLASASSSTDEVKKLDSLDLSKKPLQPLDTLSSFSLSPLPTPSSSPEEFDYGAVTTDIHDGEASASETESVPLDREHEIRTKFVEYGGPIEALPGPDAVIKTVYVPKQPVELLRHVVRVNTIARRAGLTSRDTKRLKEGTQAEEDRKKERLIAQEQTRVARQSLLAQQLEIERQEREERERSLRQAELEKQMLRNARKGRKNKKAAEAAAAAAAIAAARGEDAAAAASAAAQAIQAAPDDPSDQSNMFTFLQASSMVSGNAERTRRFLVRYYMCEALRNIHKIQSKMHPRAIFSIIPSQRNYPDVPRYFVRMPVPPRAEYLWQPLTEFSMKQRDALFKMSSTSGSSTPKSSDASSFLCVSLKTKLRRAKRDPSDEFQMSLMTGLDPEEEEEEVDKETELTATRLSTTMYLMELLREYTPPVLEESTKRVTDPYFERIYQVLLTEYAYEKPQAAPYINYQDPVTKDNILLICAARGLLDVIQLLNECYQGEIDCRVCDRDGCSALYLAAQNGHYGTVRYLVEYMNHPYVTEVPNTKWTPMLIAAARGHWPIVHFFLFEWHDAKYRYWSRYYGDRPCRYDTSQDPAPSVYETNRRGETALQVAGNNGYANIVRMLHEEDGRQRAEMRKRNQWELLRRKAQIQEEAEKAADQIIGRRDNPNVDPEARDRFIEEDMRPKIAELENEMRLKAPARLLIEMTNEDGLPPLYSALMYGQLFVVEYLLSQNARTDVPLYYIPPGTEDLIEPRHRSRRSHRSRSRSRGRTSSNDTSEFSRSAASEFSRRGSRSGADFSRTSRSEYSTRFSDDGDDDEEDDEHSDDDEYSTSTSYSASQSNSTSASAFSRRGSRSGTSSFSRSHRSARSGLTSTTGNSTSDFSRTRTGASSVGSGSRNRRLRGNALDILAAFAASEKRNNVTAEQIAAARSRGEFLSRAIDVDNEIQQQEAADSLDESIPYPHPRYRHLQYAMMLDNLFDLYIPAAEIKRQPLEVLMLYQLYERIRLDWIATTDEDLGKLKFEFVHGMESLYKPGGDQLRIRFEPSRMDAILKAPVAASNAVINMDVNALIDRALWKLQMISVWRLSNMVTLRQAEAQRNLRLCSAFKVPLSANSYETIMKRCAIVHMIDPENREWEAMEKQAKEMRATTLNMN